LAPTPNPEPEPTLMPTQAPMPIPKQTPIPSPSAGALCVPIADCGAYSWCTQSSYESWCADQGASCPAPFCRAEASPSPAPTPPLSSPAPIPRPSGRCVATLEGFYTDAATWEPYCSRLDAAYCPGPMCKVSTTLLSTSRKHKFLGTSLIQAGAGMGKRVLTEQEQEL